MRNPRKNYNPVPGLGAELGVWGDLLQGEFFDLIILVEKSGVSAKGLKRGGKMRLLITALVVSLCGWGFQAESASRYKKSLDKKVGSYISKGTFVGGRVSRGFTLLNVRRSFSKKKRMERVILDIGNLKGKPSMGEVSYYHVAVEPSRVSIDLSQVARSGVDQQKMLRIFKKSPLVKRSEITYDPEDRTTSLVLKFKRPTMVEVFHVASPDTPGRIVLDMKPKAKRSSASRRGRTKG